MAPPEPAQSRTTWLPAGGQRARRGALLAACLLLAALLATALAERVEIDTGGDPDSRLEIRNYRLPTGEEATLYVLRGDPVTVTVGAQRLEARHVEVDFTHRVLRVIGPGTLDTGSELVEGQDLVVELAEESFRGRDVLIVTEAVDIAGVEAQRVPGQINVLDGTFSPCSRCGQQVEDYGFRAERLELYPGDRLVMFGVTMVIRDRPVLELPVLVVPLAPEGRRPRLAITQGTATERAEVALDWPYAAGANAYGTFSVRYYADVDPGGGVLGRLLGGRVVTSYLGGGIDHRFYTERGAGRFEATYLPPFIDPDAPGGRSRSQVRTVFSYATAAEAAAEEGPTVEVEVARDDARRDRLVEYRVRLASVESGVSGAFTSRGFVDLDPTDAVATPSYESRTTPRRTPVELALAPERRRFEVGPLRLSNLEVVLGVYEDAGNPALRGALGRRAVQAGRLLERHSLELVPLSPWPGLELRGTTDFTGQYYSGGERLIDWRTRVDLTQRFLGSSQLGLTYTRDVTEGETPFRFDQLPLRERTDLQGAVLLAPAPWLSLRSTGAYVFSDSRNPRLEGLRPLETRLTLFENLAWITASVSNRYDFEERDPGNLEFEVTLRPPARGVSASLTWRHVQDLRATPDRLSGQPQDDTATSVAGRFGLDWLQVDFRGGYRYDPPLPESAGEPREYWQPFEVGVTLGTLDQRDALPGLRLAYARDLNRHRPQALEYEATLRLGPVELSANQRYRLPEGGQDRSRYRAIFPGYAQLELTGFALVPPAWLGLPEGPERTEQYLVSLRDAPIRGREAWELRYQTTFDPRLGPAGEGGRRNSSLRALVLLEDEVVGPARFTVDLVADLGLRDAVVELTHLRQASLRFGAEYAGTVGLQGIFGYRGTYDAGAGEVARAELSIRELALTVKATPQLYVGAILDDVWDLTGRDPRATPWNLQPTLFVVWDRCCWALYGSWDSGTGQVRISLTAPGGTEGLSEAFDTPLRLPGRREEGP